MINKLYTEYHPIIFFRQLMGAIFLSLLGIFIAFLFIGKVNLSFYLISLIIFVGAFLLFHLGSTKIFIKNDVLHVHKFFGLFSRQVKLKELANIYVRLAAFKGGLNYKVFFYDKSGAKAAFWVNEWAPTYQGQEQLFATIKDYAKHSGAIYDETATNILLP